MKILYVILCSYRTHALLNSLWTDTNNTGTYDISTCLTILAFEKMSVENILSTH